MLSQQSEAFLMKLRVTLMERGKDDQAINEIEEELRDHLTEAESNGASIDAITGGSVDQYINQISNEVPDDHKWKSYLISILGFLLVIVLLPNFFYGQFHLTLSTLLYLMIIILLFGLSWIVIKQTSIFTITKQHTLKTYLFIGLYSIAVFLILVGGIFLYKRYPIYTLLTLTTTQSIITGFILGAILLITTLYFHNWMLSICTLIILLPNIITLLIFKELQSPNAVLTSTIILQALIIINVISAFIYIKKTDAKK